MSELTDCFPKLQPGTGAGQIVSCYDKVNTVVDCAVEVNLHAFSATALDGDVPLASNSDGYFFAEKTAGTIEYESCCHN